MNLKEIISQINESHYYIYDIEYTKNGLEVNEYESSLYRRENSNVVYRNYNHIYTSYPDNPAAKIKSLKNAGYKCISEFFPNSFSNEIICPNFLLYLKICIIEKHCKLLEKNYEIISVNGKNYINTYIIYIDLKTGTIKRLDTGILGLYIEDNIELLKDYNYKLADLNNLNNNTNKLILKKGNK